MHQEGYIKVQQKTDPFLIETEFLLQINVFQQAKIHIIIGLKKTVKKLKIDF